MIALLILVTMAADPEPRCESLPTQAEMNRCSELGAKAAEAAMVGEWNRASVAMKHLDEDPDASHVGAGTYFGALLASQRAWLRFRQAECLVEGYTSRGGSYQPVAESDCYTEVTNSRTRQLRDLRGSFGL